MKREDKCSCCEGPKLIFACSGASDVGEIADHAARKLSKKGDAKMFCAAGIGGGISGIVKTTESADKILAIDGCPLSCVKSIFEKAGFKNFMHLQLAEIGLSKGNSPVTDKNVDKVTAKADEMMSS
jgi:uncharacterized metal-binding protein